MFSENTMYESYLYRNLAPSDVMKITEVTFYYSCKTAYGEWVALIGNFPILGHWDPSKAVYLSTTTQAYPVWTIKIDLPRDKIIEYKFLIVKGTPSSHGNKSAGKLSGITWE